ncbi:MAG: hypothetical protein QM811_06005 [Pirellulales bacterium]
MVDNAGKLGIAAILFKGGESLMFMMQIRSCDYEGTEVLNRYLLREKLPIKVLVSMERRMVFCPACGMDSHQMLSYSSKHEIDKLVEMHRKYCQTI